MDDLVSAKRTPAITRGRHLAMYLARELTDLSLAQIAGAFNRDHTTVMHALRSVEKRLEVGSETSETLHRARDAVHRSSTSPSTR
jgi:chromosomal replication initiator protein